MKKVLILIILFLFPLVNSQPILNADTSELEIVQKGEIELNNVYSIDVKFFVYPKSDYFSEVLSTSTNPSSEFKEDSYIFSWKNPDSKIDYEVISLVKNDFSVRNLNKEINFPFDIPKEYIKYTESSEVCDSNNLEIKKVANSLALGENNSIKVLFNLAEWVNSNIEYDLAYSENTIKASEVLELKKGTCDEFSNLVMALARSLNLPVRYVTGYSYGTYGDEGFEAHGWVEAWVPEFGWIPIDPTYGEFGWLDVSHIKGMSSENPGVSSVEYNWLKGEIIDANLYNEIEIISSQGEISNYLEGELFLEKEVVSPGSCNVIWMNLSNPTDSYISTLASLTVAPELLTKNDQMILLEPYGSDKIGWIIKYPNNLSSEYVYTYSINGSAYLLEDLSTENKVSSFGEFLDIDYCEALVTLEENSNSSLIKEIDAKILVPKEVKLGEVYSVEVILKNLGEIPIEDLGVCLEGECKEVYLGINTQETVLFERKSSSLGNSSLNFVFKNVNLASETITIQVVEKSLIEKLISILKNLFKLN